MNPVTESLREVLEAKGYFSSQASSVACVYGDEDDSCIYLCDYCIEGNIYECELCKREVPYCFGASDNFFEYCDDCWFQADKLEVKSESTT